MTVDLVGLASADLAINGRMRAASNATLQCSFTDQRGVQVDCIYKPISGERPLWDFPTGTLAHREIATYELSQLLGWNVVPPTVWRDEGPAGPGMCQLWVTSHDGEGLVDVVPVGSVPEGWRHVLDANTDDGTAVSLIHADTDQLKRMAVLDILVNNADRKGGHILVDTEGHTWGIDHGVTFSPDPKLRTVLWGWADEPIDEHILGDIEGLASNVVGDIDSIDRWLQDDESVMLRRRISDLLLLRRFPTATDDWPAIPWPVF
jgi:uncharacterized repeat protein (TIGR03843 family)